MCQPRGTDELRTEADDLYLQWVALHDLPGLHRKAPKGGPMSAPHDPWKDILAGWCGNPWEPTRFGVAGSYGWCAHCGASQQVHDIGTIHAADAAEITTLRAQNADYVEQHGKVTRCLATRTVERDALRSTVDQQQARITALEAENAALTKAVQGNALAAVKIAARQALETP